MLDAEKGFDRKMDEGETRFDLKMGMKQTCAEMFATLVDLETEYGPWALRQITGPLKAADHWGESHNTPELNMRILFHSSTTIYHVLLH
jgi:hypothetical protein